MAVVKIYFKRVKSNLAFIVQYIQVKKKVHIYHLKYLQILLLF